MTVVLLHALGVDARMWVAQERALRAAGHDVWAPHQRGHGGVPLGAAEPSLAVVADDVARGLDERGAERAVLAGTSMGGYVAMAFLRRHPGRTAALALLGTRAAADDPATAAHRGRFADAVLDPATRARALAAVVPGFVGGTTRARRPEVVERVTALVGAAAPATVAWCQHAIAARPDSFDVLRAADVPAVVVAGAEDALVPEKEARLMAEALPRGELVVVPDAGHLAAMETPGEVTSALADLLRRTGW
ncbi:alpha/beta fold hydrolase [Actinophytocola sp. KF-1]